MGSDTQTATTWRGLEMSDASAEHLRRLRRMDANAAAVTLKRAAAAELQRRAMFGDIDDE